MDSDDIKIIDYYEPDIIETVSGFAPNYEKFEGWDTEEVLVFLNID